MRNSLKKLLAGVTATVVVASSAISGLVYAAEGASNPEWEAAVQFMKEKGLSSTANSVSEYDPMGTVKREAAAKLFTNLAKNVFGMTPDVTKNCSFVDLNEAREEFRSYIIESCQLWIFKGTEDGYFLPKQVLKKHQFLTVLARIIKNDPTIEPEQAFNMLKEEWITKEGSYADTIRNVSRIELAMLFQRATEKYAEDTTADDDTTDDELGDLLGGLFGDDDDTTADDTTADDTTADDTTADDTTADDTTADDTTADDTTTVSGGDLEVALDPDTPREQYVPGTGNHIKVMKLDFIAGENDVKLSAITVTLEGMVSKSNITNVYLEDEDGNVLTNQREFNTDYEARLVFDGDFTVAANSSKKVYVVMDVAGSTNEIIKMTIKSADAVETDGGSVTGNFPITSYATHTTSYSSETLTFKGEKTSETSLSSITDTVYVWDENKRIGKIELTAGSENKRDIILKSIRLRGVESIDGKIDNVKLIIWGDNIAKDVIIDGKYVTVMIDDYVIPYGNTKTMYLYADIIGWEKNDRIQLYLDETSDISAIEDQTNAAVAVSVDSSYSYCKAYKIEEGDNLITKSSESPTSAYIPDDEDDITVLVANVNISNEMNVDKIRVFLTWTAVASWDIKRVKLYMDDKYIDEDASYTTDSDGTYAEFSYYGTLKGTHKFVVKIDTESNANDGNEISDVTIKPESIAFGSNAEYTDSKNTVSSSEIKGEASSSTFTIKTPAVESLSRTDGLSNGEKVVAGVENLSAMKFTVQANNVRDLVLNSMTVSVTDWDQDNLTNLQVVVDGEVVDTDNFNNGSATFSSLGINIPKGWTKDVELRVNVNNGYGSGVLKMKVSFNDWDFEDSKGNSLSAPSPSYVYSAEFTVIQSATVYASRDTNTPTETVIPASTTTEYEVARFKFKAVDDDAQIQELSLVNVATTFTGDYADSNASSSGYLYTGADSVVQKVYIYDVDGNKLWETSLVDGVAYFALSDYIDLPQDQDVVIVAKVKSNAINDTGTDNKYVRFALLKAGESVGTKKTKIVSTANGNEIQGSSYVDFSDAVADAQYVRATIISLADASQTSSSLSAGMNDIYAISVVADSAGSAKIKELRFDVSVTDSTTDSTGFVLDGTSFELYAGNNKFDSSEVVIYNASGSCSDLTGGQITGTANLGVEWATQGYCVRVVFTGNYVDGYELTAWSDATTFTLKADAQNVASNDSVTTRLNEVSTDVDMDTYTNTAAKTTSIIWSDEAADNVTTTTANWFTDAYVEKLPLDSWTLQQ